MTAVDFLRHGETGAGDIVLGRTDLPLSAAGRNAVVRQIAGGRWTEILTSPLARARQTAALAEAETGLVAEIADDWREIDFGDWDGKSRSALAHDRLYAAYYADAETCTPPNGEPIHEFRARITAALSRIAGRNGPVLIVTHGGAIRMALSVLLAISVERLWAMRIACGTRIRVEMGMHPSHGLWGEVVEIVQPPTGEVS